MEWYRGFIANFQHFLALQMLNMGVAICRVIAWCWDQGSKRVGRHSNLQHHAGDSFGLADFGTVDV